MGVSENRGPNFKDPKLRYRSFSETPARQGTDSRGIEREGAELGTAKDLEGRAL